MLIFDASKNKKIEMAIESQGISNDKLKFTFVIDTGEVQYGFPCQFNEGKVIIDIPPLEDVIKNIQSGTYSARLDVTGEDKYYLQPFNESVEIKQTPKVAAVSMQDDDVSEEIKLAVSSLIEVKEKKDEIANEDKNKDKNKKSEKKRGISAFFDKK
jgi:hypothetical protein